MPGLYPAGSVVSVRALLLGERIDLKGLESSQRLAVNPLLISAGEGQYAALFRYGVVVLFGVNPLQEVTFLDQLKRLVGQPFPRIETEETRMRVDPGGEDRVEGGEVCVREVTVETLQVVADVVAKSVVLGYYEASLATAFDAVEPFALGLKGGGRTTPKQADLLRYVGETLLIQHRMVGRVEVGEKPDVLWEEPALDRRPPCGRVRRIALQDAQRGVEVGPLESLDVAVERERAQVLPEAPRRRSGRTSDGLEVSREPPPHRLVERDDRADGRARAAAHRSHVGPLLRRELVEERLGVRRNVEHAQQPRVLLAIPGRIERRDETAELCRRHPRVVSLLLRDVADVALGRDGDALHRLTE